ncbi:MAG TPA: response regulator [Anaerolineales bacterium]|nr:response regulator [Anaerolineales bacterium]HLO34022.1 response regulator [Anaerolineales bacterium]
MASTGDRILLVENDPEISDLIARQVLTSVGYYVDVVVDSTSAIKQALLTPPDLIIADLNLPGLSAKDLLVALSSQGMNTPLLVIANKGQEQDIIQAFRLGAADYLLWPARDAEILSVVERLLGHVHELRDRQRLDLKLSEMNHELQRKMRELSALINLGKAVTSITDQRLLFQKIVDGAAQVADANTAWLLVRDDESKSFLLTAQRGLPEVWAKKLNLPLDDGISGLVALSGETLSISGEPLLKFRVANLGRSACAVPIKVQNEVIGMLVVVRKETRPFEKMEQTLLEAVADYASISLLNARLFRALNSSTQVSKEGERRQNALLESIRSSITEELQAAIYPIELLLKEKNSSLTELQRQALQTARAALQRLGRAAEKTTPPVPITLKKK